MAKDHTDAGKAAKDAKKALEGGDPHVFILMDESGSMAGLREHVVAGVNEFVEEFKGSDTRIWFGAFDKNPGDDILRIKRKGVKAKKCDPLAVEEYKPRGLTPLNDAILLSLKKVESATAKGDGVFFAIFTDGLENASEASAATVKEAIKKFEKKGWTFVYLGANQNAQQAGAAIGLGQPGAYFNYTASASGVRTTTRRMASAAAGYIGELGEMPAAMAAESSRLSRAALGDTIPEEDEEAHKTPSSK